MILSNLELHAALDSGRLVISKEPAPRIPVEGEASPYGTHSVDLRLANEIRVPQPRRRNHVRLALKGDWPAEVRTGRPCSLRRLRRSPIRC